MMTHSASVSSVLDLAGSDVLLRFDRAILLPL
jgi:hypothetical protein